MIKPLNILGHVVFLLLLIYFIWRVVSSGQKLFERKIGSVKSKHYSKWRLFPSLSICYRKINLTAKSLLEDIDGNLQKVLTDDVISFHHDNVTESG